MRTNDSEIGKIREFILKFLTKLQEKSINNHLGFYNLVTKLHFKVYSGMSLGKAVMSDNKDELDMFALAANRHGNMVVTLCCPEAKDKGKLKKMITESFAKNYIR